MKNIFIKSIIMLLFAFATNKLKAQSKIVTDTITVKGSCGMCKKRIEEATYVKGVKTADWNKNTQVLTVVYNTKKTTIEEVAKAIALAGHDNRFLIAEDKNYNTIPGCCAYRTSTCDHD